jgi:hypothetical protein
MSAEDQPTLVKATFVIAVIALVVAVVALLMAM